MQLGHASVFYYLHRDLKLSKGAAHYRKVAAQLIQKFPAVVAPFREGKLCITTVVELARVITPENSADVLPRFFYLSKQFLDKLDAARKGQGHAQPGASAEKVIEAALDLLQAQQARRRAEVKRPQKNPRPAKNPGHIPASVKRAVWSRDDGKCTWPLDSGGICGSTLRLEIDHVVPRGRGGASTVDGCRLPCAAHNQLAARQVFGDEWMDQFTSGDARDVPMAREAAAPWGRLPGSRQVPGPPIHVPVAGTSAYAPDFPGPRAWPRLPEWQGKEGPGCRRNSII